MYLFAYTCMYRIFLCMYVWILVKCGVRLTITLDCWFTFLPAFEAPSLMCCFPSCVFTQASKVRKHSTFRVLKQFMHLPWVIMNVMPLLPTRKYFLPLCATAIKAILYDPLLGLLHQIIWGLVGTSYLGDRLTCWWFHHCQHFWC